jgi:hypothetical protein
MLSIEFQPDRRWGIFDQALEVGANTAPVIKNSTACSSLSGFEDHPQAAFLTSTPNIRRFSP